MRIGVDVMGGDFAPHEAVKACVIAAKQYTHFTTVLFGDKQRIAAELTNLGEDIAAYEVVHTAEVVEMSEHPTKALAQKKDSSIAVGFKNLAEKNIDAFVGAGNTGAMLVGAMYSVKAIQGVHRPVITSIVPKANGGMGILLDVGANADCKPEVLNQFALLGSLYCQYVYGIEKPKVGLMSIGEEKEKGNLLVQSTFPLMEANERINFIGNVEGRDLFTDKADVFVCDGFTGNVIIKCYEGLFYQLMKRNVKDDFLDRFNFKNYGGTAILGVNAPVIIGHGISKADTILKMIKLGEEVAASGLIEKIKTSF